MPTTLEQLDAAIATSEKRRNILDDAIRFAESRFELSDQEFDSVRSSMPPKSFAETVAGNTTLGLVGRAINRATLDEPYIEPNEQDFGTFGNIAAEVGSIGLDPAMLAGGVAGAKVAEKVLGKRLVGESLKRGAARGAIASGTLLGGMAATHDPLTQYRETGEIDPAQAARATAEGAILGAALGPASQAGRAIAPSAGRLVQGAINVGAETSVFAGGTAALQGRLPNTDDVTHAAGVVLGTKSLGLVAKLGDRLKNRAPDADPKAILVDTVGVEKADEILQQAIRDVAAKPPEKVLTSEPSVDPTVNEKLAALADNETVSRKDFATATGQKVGHVPVAAERKALADAEAAKLKGTPNEEGQAGQEVPAKAEEAQREAVLGEPAASHRRPLPTWRDFIASEGVQGAIKTNDPRYGELKAKYDTLREVDVKPSESASGFIPTSPGDVAIGAIKEKLDAGWKAIKAIPKAFRTRGDLPQEVFDLNVERTGELRARDKQTVFSARDTIKAIKREYGEKWSKLHPSELENINAVLAGETVPLPPKVAEAVNVMRAAIDSQAREILDTLPLGEKMRAVIAGNHGVYLRRSYKAFHDPKWAEKVPEHIRDRFKQEIINEYWDWINEAKTEAAMEKRASEPPPTSEQMDGIIEAMLYKASESRNPLAFFAEGKLGSKDVTSLIKRKDLSEALRALLGEEKDPIVNFIRTRKNQAQLIANHKFLSKVREAGLGKFLFEEPTVEARAQIAASGSESMNPLNGLYTTPEIASEFAKWDSQPTVGPLAKWYYRGLIGAKAAKTVYSHTGIIRNFISNPMIELANGNIAFWRIGKPMDAILAELGWTDKPPSREYLEQAVRLGIIDDSAGMRELFDIFQRAGGRSLDDVLYDPTGNMLKKAGLAGVKAWQAADNLYKLFGWETERSRYRKAKPDWSEDRVNAYTAQIIRNTRPTYSMLPKAVQSLGRAPLGETFVAWPAEIIRNSYNILRLAATELADPSTRSIGAKRLVGSMAAAGATAAATGALRFMTGTNPQNQKDAERFVLPYQEDAPIALLKNPKDGKTEYLDLSFTDPYTVLRKPILAFMRGDDWRESFWGSAKSILGQFFGENLIVSAAIDIWRGETQDGWAVYNPQDALYENLKKIGDRAIEPFWPGSAASLERLRKAYSGKVEPSGRSYNPTVETIAQFGVRAQEMDVRQRLLRKADLFGENLKDAYGVAREKIMQPGEVTDEELASATKQSATATRKLVAEIHEDAMAAIRLGVPEEDVLDVFVSAGLSRKEIGSIMNNDPSPYEIDKGTVRRAMRRSKIRGQDPEKRLQSILKRSESK